MVISKSFEQDEVLGFKFAYRPRFGPVLFTHIYFIDGLLIDTGQRKARKQILATTQDLEVAQIFLTHHHEDHTGNIEALQQLHACEVYASARCVDMMRHPPPLSFAQKMTWGSRPPHDGLVPLDGKLETEHYTFELIPIPGHAPDMVALYEPERKWLFSADLYLNAYIDYFLAGECMETQIRSIKRVLQLDFKDMFCAHKPQFGNGKVQLQKKLDFLESFFTQVAALHQKGYTADEVFTALQLQENRLVKWLSGGKLSKMNMVRSVVSSLTNQ